MAHRHMSDLIRRRPVTLHRSASVQEACRMMHEHRIGAILVMGDDAGLEGIFTGRDVVRLLAEGKSPAHTPLDEVMTRNPETMRSGHDAMSALRLMQDGGFRHVPVVDEGMLVGIVSHGDFRAFEHARLDEETQIWERI